MLTSIELRNIPTYSVSEAAGYLAIPVDRLRSWVSDRQAFKPLIELPNAKTKQLSFINLVEAYMLSAISQVQPVSSNQLRAPINYINEKFPIPHLLARIEFQDALHLFVENLAQELNISSNKEAEIKIILITFINRIERDDEGLAIRLFPLTQPPAPDAPKTVMIDPRISFGRPVLAGTGIPTAILAERYQAGESVDALADDYDCLPRQIEEGIYYQLQAA